MHEMGFTKQIVETILGALKKRTGEKPKRVKVSVGGMFHLNRESVLMHYNVLTKGTDLETVELDLREEPVTVLCNQCQGVSSVEDHHFLVCSFCNARDVKVIGGQEIYAELIEAE